MSVVYKAHHVSLSRTVALKLMKAKSLTTSESIKRFQKEAQLASGLAHKNITKILTFDIYDSQPYLAFEYLQGESLADRLNRSRHLDFADFIEVFSQVCDGLQYAHEAGVIHRDLKPGNIFIADNGPERQVKVMDFGIAKELGLSGEQVQKLTETGEVLGTPMYMSPEQSRGEPLDAQSDIFSLGCVMYEAISGQTPFIGSSSMELLYNRIYGTAQPLVLPEDYPDQTTQLIQNAMSKERSSRYESIAHLKTDLLNLRSLSIKTTARVAPKSAVALPLNNVKGQHLFGNLKLQKIMWASLALVAICLVAVVIIRTPEHCDQLNNWKDADKRTRVATLADILNRDGNDIQYRRELFRTALPDLKSDHSVAATKVYLANARFEHQHGSTDQQQAANELLKGTWKEWPQSEWDHDIDVVNVLEQIVNVQSADRNNRLTNTLIAANWLRHLNKPDAADKVMLALVEQLCEDSRSVDMLGLSAYSCAYDYFVNNQRHLEAAHKLMKWLAKVGTTDEIKLVALTKDAELYDVSIAPSESAPLWQAASNLTKRKPLKLNYAARSAFATVRTGQGEKAEQALRDLSERYDGCGDLDVRDRALRLIDIGDAYAFLDKDKESKDCYYKALQYGSSPSSDNKKARFYSVLAESEVFYRLADYRNLFRVANEAHQLQNGMSQAEFGSALEAGVPDFFSTADMFTRCPLLRRAEASRLNLPPAQVAQLVKCDSVAAHKELISNWLYKCGDFSEAASTWIDAAKQRQSEQRRMDAALDLSMAATSIMQCHRNMEAIDLFRQAAALNSVPAYAYAFDLSIASCMENLKDYTGANAILESKLAGLLALPHENSGANADQLLRSITDLRFRLADNYFSAQEFEKAAESYSAALKPLSGEGRKTALAPHLGHYKEVLKSLHKSKEYDELCKTDGSD